MDYDAFRIGDRCGPSRASGSARTWGRTIVAVTIDAQVIADPSWLNGPPYAVAEFVFDEYDFEGCYPTAAERDAEGVTSMAHHKRRRPKNTRAGCLLCKPHKMSGWKKRVRLKGLRVPRLLTNIDDGKI
jgi:hypothetical protein